MKSPRIYTYRVTFEEIPHWYWGVHKEKKFGETYLGSPCTHKWMWEFYTPKVQILEFFPYTEEGWKEANLVEDRLITPDLNNPLCLNERSKLKSSLKSCSKGGKIGGLATHQEKNEEGKSVRAVEYAKRLHSRKDELGRSVAAMETLSKLHSERDAEGKSIHARKMGKKSHQKKNKEGKSERAVEIGSKGGKSSTSQVWESIIDGFRSTAGNVAKHNRAKGWDPAARIRIL
jgi:hypothetical protein